MSYAKEPLIRNRNPRNGGHVPPQLTSHVPRVAGLSLELELVQGRSPSVNGWMMCKLMAVAAISRTNEWSVETKCNSNLCGNTTSLDSHSWPQISLAWQWNAHTCLLRGWVDFALF